MVSASVSTMPVSSRQSVRSAASSSDDTYGFFYSNFLNLPDIKSRCGVTQAGVHMIYAHIDHEAVDGSPLVIEAKPGAPCLAASQIDESALTSAVAGEHCAVLLTTFNDFGDAITEGGAVITATLMSHGNSFFTQSRYFMNALI